MYPHRIRLRGPWQAEPLARTPGDERPLPPAQRMTLPCHWRDDGLTDFAGRVRLRRRFGYPGRIDSYERVWLRFEGIAGTAEMWLNEQPLGRTNGTAGPFEFKVTGLLLPRNELIVELEAGPDGGLWGEVVLEVRRSAFLRDVRAWLTPEGEKDRLHIAGDVVGRSARPLELYAVLDRYNVHYSTLTPTPEGASFEATSEIAKLDDTTPHELRVDLVDAASVWYTWQTLLSR